MRQPLHLTANLARYLIGKRLRGEPHVPVVLMLEPLYTCNFACPGCSPERRTGTKADWLPVEECLRAVDECGAPIVSVCGGEPLIHDGIHEIVRGILDRGKYCIICTNALLLPRFMEKTGPDPHLSLAIHLDGLEATHDRLTGHPGAFQKALAATRAAVARGFRVNSNTTLFVDTEIDEVVQLFAMLMEEVRIDSLLITPGYDFSNSGNGHFLKREQVVARFQELLARVPEGWFGNSSLYLDFLKGETELICTPWGNPTRSPQGWQGPCYMLRDAFHPTYRELIEKTPWAKYGTGSGEVRCEGCMLHAGFEPTVALGRQIPVLRQLGNAVRMFK
jgi:hopanoid biosynthesis associated radical SAM protein HpnH